VTVMPAAAPRWRWIRWRSMSRADAQHAWVLARRPARDIRRRGHSSQLRAHRKAVARGVCGPESAPQDIQSQHQRLFTIDGNRHLVLTEPFELRSNFNSKKERGHSPISEYRQ
jgi:hypothetical protein